MRKRLLFLSAVFIIIAGALTLREWQRYNQSAGVYAPGTFIGPLPAGGLTVVQAADQLQAVFQSPIEMVYQGARIQANPLSQGFQLRSDRIEDTAPRPSTYGFWRFLWNRTGSGQQFELPADVDEASPLTYLENEVRPRYDEPARPGRPSMDGLGFVSGRSGTELDSASAAAMVRAALLSADQRVVELPVREQSSANVDISVLDLLLRHALQRSGFDGTAELYLKDLQTGESVAFALHQGSDVPTDIAFTAASTIKIPIAISILRRYDEPLPGEIVRDLQGMFFLSDNPSADRLMARLDSERGPLLVSEDATLLGLENTFLAGYFAPGSPLLQFFDTPANTRSDIDLDPDVYNQTTPSEIGVLLEGLYRCAYSSNGLLVETFTGEITAGECQQVIDILSINKNGLLVEAGLPEGTWLAHKHGWIEEADGLLHTVSDVSLVRSPGEDFVLTIYLYDDQQLLFDAANHLVAELAHISYNYFNIEQQADWPFGPTQYRR